MISDCYFYFFLDKTGFIGFFNMLQAFKDSGSRVFLFILTSGIICCCFGPKCCSSVQEKPSQRFHWHSQHFSFWLCIEIWKSSGQVLTLKMLVQKLSIRTQFWQRKHCSQWCFRLYANLMFLVEFILKRTTTNTVTIWINQDDKGWQAATGGWLIQFFTFASKHRLIIHR